jgi:NAD(P)-dependent dehydrogenase (short-subunit alcohol dehydrogenase family)
MSDFEGLTALVTGGASGIGRATNPGTVDTPWVGRLLGAAPDPAAERAALEARQPTGRLVSAAEVAGAIAYLASPLSGAATGTALAVDGGMQGLRLRQAAR